MSAVIAEKPTTRGTSSAHVYLARLAKIHAEGLEAIIARGEILIEARERLSHGEWQTFCEGLPFSQRHAHRLRQIAAHPILSNRTLMSVLPDKLVILYALSTLAPDVVQTAIDAGIIHPGMTLADARTLAGRGARRADASSGPGGPRRQRRQSVWTLAGCLGRIDRALAGAPGSAKVELAAALRDRADLLHPTPADRPSRGRPGARLRGDLAARALELITLGYRAAARKHHPDAGGDEVAMKEVNLVMEYLRAEVGGGR